MWAKNISFSRQHPNSPQSRGDKSFIHRLDITSTLLRSTILAEQPADTARKTDKAPDISEFSTGTITGIAHDFGRGTPSLKEKPPTHTPAHTHLKEKPPTQRENRAKPAIFSACGRKIFHFPVSTPIARRAGAIKVSFTVSTSHRHCFAAPSLRNNPLTRPGKPIRHRHK